MKTIKEQRLDFLNEMVNYYSEDTSRRAEEKDSYFCRYYDEKTGNRCAIGRYIKLQDYLANNLDAGHFVNEYYVFALLPDEIRRLGKEFLKEVQSLHDNRNFYLTNQLSDEGKHKVEEIIEQYCK